MDFLCRLSAFIILQPTVKKDYQIFNANKLRVLTKTKIRNIAIEWKSKANSSFFCVFSDI